METTTIPVSLHGMNIDAPMSYQKMTLLLLSDSLVTSFFEMKWKRYDPEQENPLTKSDQAWTIRLRRKRRRFSLMTRTEKWHCVLADGNILAWRPKSRRLAKTQVWSSF